MRFDELTIEKYGVYDKRTLSLAEMPGLVVIYGPNEAGKTTCLAAIIDFLFGIQPYSTHGHLFGYEQMRLRARLGLANGDQMTFCRRKGRGIAKTLIDQDNNIVEETVLSTLLGSTTRARFEALFGLSHESLRKGGQQLLDAEGDIGRLIVEAGGGLRSLVGSLNQLGEEADRLFSIRRSADRAFYKALDSFEAAEREIKGGLLTREAYEQGQKQHEAAKEMLDNLRTERQAVSGRLLRQRRLVRVIPHLNDLNRVEEAIETFTDVRQLRADFGLRVRQALDGRKSAQEAFAEAVQKRSDLENQIKVIVVSSALAEAEATIRDICEIAVHVTKERSDRPKREAELSEREEKLSSLKQRVGAKGDADLEGLMPSQSAMDRVQGLVAQGLDLRPKIESLQIQIDNDTETIERLQTRQSDREMNGYEKPFGISSTDFSQLPILARNLETKRRQAGRMQEEIIVRVQAMMFESLQDLQAFRGPDTMVIQAEIDRNTLLEAALIKQADVMTAQTSSLNAAVAIIERLKKAGEVPTDAAIATARHERDGAWVPIRETYLTDDTEAVARLPLTQRAEAVIRLEERINKADYLSDRKSTEAQRIATLDLAEKQKDEATALFATAATAKDEIQKGIVDARIKWAERWPQATRREAELSRLKGIIEEREVILGEVSDLDGLRDEIERLDADISPRLETLALAEQRLAMTANSNGSLALRVQAVTQGIEVHNNAYSDFRRDGDTITTIADQLQRKQMAITELKNSVEIWRDEWKQAVRHIRLSEDSSPERGNEVVTLWAAAGGILDGIRLTRKRLQRMDEDECELKRLIDKVAEDIDFALPRDAIAAARMLKEKSDSNNNITIARDSLVSQLGVLTNDRDRKQRSLDAADAAIAALCTEALCDGSGLPHISERHTLHLSMQSRRLQILETIASAGDGISIEVLRNQWGGRDLAEVMAELKQIEDTDQLLEKAIEEAAGNLRDREREIGRFKTEEGINKAVAERERAGAELRRVIEDYMETTLAKELLSAAIERIRHQQQDPLITRAGELFSLTTDGAFVTIETDVDDSGYPIVVGRRRSGETVPIETMSDGSRDQLFLAFRLAAIEHYCASAEPLPFIADDLLVQFDDKRSKATLELLAEFGKSTQVLLFTHHRSVLDSATKLVNEGSVSVLELT